MDSSDEEKSYRIKNGKSIIGSIGAYQEKFGGSDKEIMQMPYLMFLFKMQDCPSIDYEGKKSKKGKKKKRKQKLGFGTPISELTEAEQKQIR